MDKPDRKKKILVTGGNSYIAGSFLQYMEKFSMARQADCDELYDGQTETVKLLSVRGDAWEQEDFSQYDVVIHCAGIVHRKEKEVPVCEYYRVNRDLTRKLAEKAKNDGTGQFIFISTMNVYGMSTGVITATTEPAPESLYGKSKLEAEKALQDLQSDAFKVCIVRPPMIYGSGCRGNYRLLAKLARIIPVFPETENERSMLYIDNLCELLRLLVENEEAGIFFPQDEEYVRTSEMVKQIAACHGKKIVLTRMFQPVISIFFGSGIVKKVFGSLVYEKAMSEYSKADYRVTDFRKAVEECEYNPDYRNRKMSFGVLPDNYDISKQT